MKRLPLNALRYNFRSLWAKCSLVVSASVEIASLILCRCTQRGSQLRFLAAYRKTMRCSGGHCASPRTSEVQTYQREEAEPWGPRFPLRVWVGWRVGPMLGDQSGEVHTVNTGFVSQPRLSKRKVLISTEVRGECCWSEVIVIWIFA